MSVEAVQFKSAVVCVILDEVKLVGAVGAVVSGTGNVVIKTVLLADETLAAASNAVIEKL